LSYFSGGGIIPFVSDAEIWGYNNNINVYGSSQFGFTQFVPNPNNDVVKSAMLIELGRRRFHIKNYAGYSHGTLDDGLFTYNNNYLYLGLNRVISDMQGKPFQERSGHGLCSVCLLSGILPVRSASHLN